MRQVFFLLCLGMMLPVAALAADETAYVAARPAIPLFAAPLAESDVLRRLVPGDSVTVLANRDGYVNVQLGDGARGWLGEADVTSTPPASVRVTELEQEAARLREQLAAAQSSLQGTQSRLRQAQQAASAARESGADETAQVAAERDRLQALVADQETTIRALQRRVTEMEMARDAARLLARERDSAGAATTERFSKNELLAAAAVAAGLALAGLWLGAGITRRRIRRRYHGLEL